MVPKYIIINYIYDNDTIDIKCMTCCKCTNEMTPYHYKLESTTCVLLVPEEFVPEIWPKCTIKKFFSPDFFSKAVKISNILIYNKL